MLQFLLTQIGKLKKTVSNQELTKPSAATDADALDGNGVWGVTSKTANVAIGTGTLLQFVIYNGNKAQIQVVTNHIYFRYYSANNETWGGWRECTSTSVS